ncbi:hypothetical protein BCCH1_58560 [Burkholderia contaminans]|uniref:Uncharacterized protein n=1 Tax=Burkholderia contaminans TaxID=488447 RepID=A0A250LFR3_9BURK|nr:hypothetical protein BCCH1_58560 [Burkholderia contaminans]
MRCRVRANAHRTQCAGKRALESIATTTRIVQQRGEPRMAHPDEPQCSVAAKRERFARSRCDRPGRRLPAHDGRDSG